MKRFLIITLSLLTALLLASCSLRTPSTHLYSLNTGTTTSPPTSSTISVGVGPIELPNILERPQIVTRKKNNEVEIAELHQWGGRLEQDIGQLIAETVVSKIESPSVYTYPWPRRLRPDFQVSIRFARLDGIPGELVTLSALWELRDKEDKHDSAIHRSFVQEPIDGNKYPAYVAAISRALQTLSAEIGEAILKVNSSHESDEGQ